MRYAIIAAAALAVTACTSETKPVRDVQHFLDHPEELEELLQKCGNNPGQLSNEPECINAMEAHQRQINEEMKRFIENEL